MSESEETSTLNEEDKRLEIHTLKGIPAKDSSSSISQSQNQNSTIQEEDKSQKSDDDQSSSKFTKSDESSSKFTKSNSQDSNDSDNSSDGGGMGGLAAFKKFQKDNRLKQLGNMLRGDKEEIIKIQRKKETTMDEENHEVMDTNADKQNHIWVNFAPEDFMGDIRNVGSHLKRDAEKIALDEIWKRDYQPPSLKRTKMGSKLCLGLQFFILRKFSRFDMILIS